MPDCFFIAARRQSLIGTFWAFGLDRESLDSLGLFSLFFVGRSGGLTEVYKTTKDMDKVKLHSLLSMIMDSKKGYSIR